MNIIYKYDYKNGCLLGTSIADESPLDNEWLLPAYATTSEPPVLTELNTCARYLTDNGAVPSCSQDGSWTISPDWRGVSLWNTETQRPVSITDPGITPSSITATHIEPPGEAYKWSDDEWVADSELAHELALKSAQAELGYRSAVATTQIEILKPAVEAGYAKPEHTQLLAAWQRCRYELTLVPEQAGWPYDVNWPDAPQ